METLPYRRDPRPIEIDLERCRADVKRAVPPDWVKWMAKTPELVDALLAAQAKYAVDPLAKTSVLADAVASLAVVWTDVTSAYAIVGPGIDPLQPTVAPLVDWWVAERGIPHAIDALVAACGLVQTISPVQIEPHTQVASGNLTATRQPARWRRLREHVARASDAAYAEAHAHAERLRASKTAGARILTSFVFPWEAEWARADAKASLEGTLALIGTALDGRTCADILERSNDAEMIFEDGRFATMVEMLGDEALQPLRAVMKMTWLDLTVPTALLARFATPEVATTMADALDGSVAETARDFFRKNPELALGALLGPTTISAKHARYTKPLLASAVARAHERAMEIAKKTKNARERNLLTELGATDEWLGKKKPKRLLDAVAKYPAVNAWVRTGAPWSGRNALAEVKDETELVAIVHAAANDALPIAMAAIDALASLPNGLKWLGRIEHAPVRPEVDEHARCRARSLATPRGLVDDDVDDLAAPSFANVLDYGARRFFARLDAEMKPSIYDADGKRVASLPRAGKNDDASLAAHAAETWTIFRDDAASEASAQAARMEQAMLAGRAFPDEIFRGVVVPHPVLGTLARRLVWRDARGVLFRVAEDGSFASADDEITTIALPVRIADPTAMTDPERFRWSEVMASYEIVQPFPQLGRPPPSPTDH